MKLLLALYLLSSCFCSVFVLQCLNCSSDSGQCTTTLSQQCEEGHVCVSAAYNIFLPGVIGFYRNVSDTGVKRDCIAVEHCEQVNAVGKDLMYSIHVGVAYASVFVSCCESDDCNKIPIPELDNKPNGLKCLTCDSYSDNVCNSTMSCVGNQHHCITSKAPFFPLASEKLLGCVSKTFCDMLKNVPGLEQFQCCSGNLCNSESTEKNQI